MILNRDGHGVITPGWAGETLLMYGKGRVTLSDAAAPNILRGGADIARFLHFANSLTEHGVLSTTIRNAHRMQRGIAITDRYYKACLDEGKSRFILQAAVLLPLTRLRSMFSNML